MKKNVFFLSFLLSLFILGCGGGGVSTTSSAPVDGGGGDGGGGGISGPVGTLTVVFSGSGSEQGASPLLHDDNVARSGSALPVENGFRVTASKYVTSQVLIDMTEDEPPLPIYQIVTTRTYFAYGDNTVPGTVTLKLPVDNEYLIEVVSFDTNPLNPFSSLQMIRYTYADNISINEGPNAITQFDRPFGAIADNTILFSHSDQITGGNVYTMKVTYNSRVPLRDTFNFADNTLKSFIMDGTAPYKIGVPFNRTAPVGVLNDNIYFQGQFYINDSMLSDSQRRAGDWKKYRLNAPASYNMDIFHRLFLPGDVTIIIPPGP